MNLAQSTLVVTDPSQWDALITELAADIHPADFWVQSDREKPAAIADVRDAKFAAVRVPFGEFKRIVLLWADRSSVPVANSLLKLLEEPPEKVQIILLAETDHVLPTIASRVRIIRQEQVAEETPSQQSDWKQLLAGFNPAIPAERTRLRELLYLTPLVHATVQTNTLLDGYQSL